MPNPRVQESFRDGHLADESSDEESDFVPQKIPFLAVGVSKDLPTPSEAEETESKSADTMVVIPTKKTPSPVYAPGTAIHIPDTIDYKDQGRNLGSFINNNDNNDEGGTRTPPHQQDEYVTESGGVAGSTSDGGGGGGGGGGAGSSTGGSAGTGDRTTPNPSHTSGGSVAGSHGRGEPHTGDTQPKGVVGTSASGHSAVDATVRSADENPYPARPGLAVAAEIHDPEKERQDLRHQVSYEIELERRQKIMRVMKFVIPFAVLLIAAVVVFVVAPWDNVDNNGSSINGPIGKVFDVDFSEVFISGLCSPRHLTIFQNTLYIPEAGIGPSVVPVNDTTSPDCFLSPFGYYICQGFTGRVSSFRLTGPTTVGRPVLEDLWSARAVTGRAASDVYGVHGVAFDQRTGFMLAVVGLGYVNATEFSERNPSRRETFGTLIGRDGFVYAVPWETEFANNFNDAPAPESNPFGVTVDNGNIYMVDAGGDALYTYLKAGLGDSVRLPEFRAQPDAAFALPKVTGIAAVTTGRCNDVTPPRGPFYCGVYNNSAGDWLYDTAAVPTQVQVHQGKLYVSYLAGIFWNEPHANIWEYELDANGIPMEGSERPFLPLNTFWAIIDFEFYDGDVWVLETNPGSSFVPFDGRLSRVTGDGTVVVLSEDLMSPIGLAISVEERRVFVSNNAVNGGLDDCNGEIRVASLTTDRDDDVDE